MSEDFYCDNVLSGKIEFDNVLERDNVLALHHPPPCREPHTLVIPKRHIASLLTLGDGDDAILLELFEVIRLVAADVVKEKRAARVLTNLGNYQDSKHLHFHVYSGDRVYQKGSGGK